MNEQAAGVMDDVLGELAAIDEKLIRHELLTFLERGEHLARREEIYKSLALYPETKHGASGSRGSGNGVYVISKNGTAPFLEDTASMVGASRSVVEEAVQIANKLDADVRDMLRETPVANRKRELLIMARMGRNEQLETARRLQDGAKSVYEAISQQQQERIEEARLSPRRVRTTVRYPVDDEDAGEGDW